MAYKSFQARGQIKGCSCWPMSQPQQCQFWATSANYTPAHSNDGSLTHWEKPGIEPLSSWTLCRALNPLSHSGNSSIFPFCHLVILRLIHALTMTAMLPRISNVQGVERNRNRGKKTKKQQKKHLFFPILVLFLSEKDTVPKFPCISHWPLVATHKAGEDGVCGW